MSVVDFHTHILPGIDDGANHTAQSLEMLRRQAEQGVEVVVATPHFYPSHDSPRRFLARRRESEERLRAAMEEIPGLPKLLVGAEVYFFEGISDCEFLREMAIEGTDCVMIEMPMDHWSDRNLQELVGIRQKLKLTPIVAHVDRYIRPLQTHGIPQRLAELPVYVQANAGFFEKKSTQRMALRLLREGKIHLLGSDCHNLDSRAPDLEAAVRIIQRVLPDALSRINHLESKIMNLV
ncbi:MAG: capsular polysaccharide biosynthesis protein [Clostridia bacterium]|nr:capsular polysaccharide biosynthesis protein [Clostridia bacterium]